MRRSGGGELAGSSGDEARRRLRRIGLPGSGMGTGKSKIATSEFAASGKSKADPSPPFPTRCVGTGFGMTAFFFRAGNKGAVSRTEKNGSKLPHSTCTAGQGCGLAGRRHSIPFAGLGTGGMRAVDQRKADPSPPFPTKCVGTGFGMTAPYVAAADHGEGLSESKNMRMFESGRVRLVSTTGRRNIV
jgi:hypothetical protein